MQTTDKTSNIGPEFKPGDKPYLQFGNEILNNNIPWSEVLAEIINKGGLSIAQVAGKLHTTINTLKNLGNGNQTALSFKQGARLLTLHEVALRGSQ